LCWLELDDSKKDLKIPNAILGEIRNHKLKKRQQLVKGAVQKSHVGWFDPTENGIYDLTHSRRAH
jgi:hypothetical protein